MLQTNSHLQTLKGFKDLRLSILNNFVSQKSFDEIENLKLAENLDEKNKDLLLRSIFDESRKLGLKILENNNSINVEKIIKIIESANIPCFSGNWTPKDENNSFHLERSICPCPVNSFACLFWREGLDGFIMGIGDNERYSRHRSIIFGKNVCCTDVIFDSQNCDYKHGIVPDEMRNYFIPVFEKLTDLNVKLIFEGFSEKTLFYRIKDSNSSLAPFRYRFIIESVEKHFFKKYNDLELVEISPRAVIEGNF